MAAHKEAELHGWLREHRRIAIGYSGGVDSAYLAAVAVGALGADRVLAVTGRSASYPESQWAAARETARAIGLEVLEIDTDELEDPRYAANPTNRCYFCKTELWSHVVPGACARGIAVVADGTNADDLSDHRPGARAARELGVVSPLADVRTHESRRSGTALARSGCRRPSSRRRPASRRGFRTARPSPSEG